MSMVYGGADTTLPGTANYVPGSDDSDSSRKRDYLTQLLMAQYGLVPPGPANYPADPSDPASENVSDGFSAMNDPGPGYGSMGFASQGPTSAATQAQAAITDAMGSFQSAPAQEAAPSPTNMGVFDTSEPGVNANPGSMLAAGIPGFGLFGAFTNNNPDEALTGDINGPGWNSPNPDAPSPSPAQTASVYGPNAVMADDGTVIDGAPSPSPAQQSPAQTAIAQAAPQSQQSQQAPSPALGYVNPGYSNDSNDAGPTGFSSSTDANAGPGTGYGGNTVGYGGDIAGGLGTGFGTGTGPDAGFSAGFDAGVSAATGAEDAGGSGDAGSGADSGK